MKVVVLISLIAASSALKKVKSAASINGRIIGGQQAYAGQYPWAAAIYLTTNNGNYFCGGALLSNLYVITAGQCVDGALLFTVLLGTHLLEGNDKTVRVATETYFLHPSYNPVTLENDLGIIRLRAPITFSDYLSSVPIAFYASGDGYSATAVGWGQVNDAGDGLVNNLNWVKLSVLSTEACRTYYGSQIVENMLCTVGEYNEGTCIGDSGSPLVQTYKTTYMVSGVSSFVSANGCESTFPSGYTRVYEYREWIVNVTIQ